MRDKGAGRKDAARGVDIAFALAPDRFDWSAFYEEFARLSGPRCAWPTPNCDQAGTDERQMLHYCEPHAALVDANRSEMTGPR